MSAPPVLWDGRPLGQGPFALIVVLHRKQRKDDKEQPTLGVVSDGVVTVILPPEQLGLFVEAHATATLVCYDAADLHWCLHRYLAERGQDVAVQALWALSRHARLHDIMLLDQATRRFAGEAMPAARTLAELAVKRTGMELPADPVLIDRVAAEFQTAVHVPDHELWTILASAASAVMQVYQQLRGEVDAILTVVANTNRPAILPSSSLEDQENIREQTRRLVASVVERMKERKQERLAESGVDLDLPAVAQAEIESTAEDGQPGPDAAETAACDAVSSPTIDYGPLGVGIEVQGTIAQHQPKPRGCLVDPDELAPVRTWSKRRFDEAEARLRSDHTARGWLPQSGRPSALAPQNLSDPSLKNLKVWLSKAGERLCDIHGCPASVPLTAAKEPCPDPDAWGVWTACDALLRAWRDLVSAARLYDWAQDGGHVRYAEAVVLRNWGSPPNPLTLRAVTSSVFRPSAGSVFLLGTLDGLRSRCLAAVSRWRSYSGNGRLFGFHLRGQDYLDTVAGELFVYFTGGLPNASLVEEETATDSPATEIPDLLQEECEPDRNGTNVDAVTTEGDVERFAELRSARPELYSYWRRLARALVETLPLGLPVASQRFLMAQDYGIDELTAADIERLNGLLVRKVAYELQGFGADDTLEQVASGLGVPVGAIFDALPRMEHVETIDARVRNDLIREQSSSPVRLLIAEAEREGRAMDLAPSKDRAKRWLHRAPLTLGGRALPPNYCAQARRAEYLAAVEEVRMAVAYALVAAGFELVALHDDNFVLQLPEAEAGAGQTQERIRRVVFEAGQSLLGNLAPPCQLYRWGGGEDDTTGRKDPAPLT